MNAVQGEAQQVVLMRRVVFHYFLYDWFPDRLYSHLYATVSRKVTKTLLSSCSRQSARNCSEEIHRSVDVSIGGLLEAGVHHSSVVLSLYMYVRRNRKLSDTSGFIENISERRFCTYLMVPLCKPISEESDEKF